MIRSVCSPERNWNRAEPRGGCASDPEPVRSLPRRRRDGTAQPPRDSYGQTPQPHREVPATDKFLKTTLRSQPRGPDTVSFTQHVVRPVPLQAGLLVGVAAEPARHLRGGVDDADVAPAVR